MVSGPRRLRERGMPPTAGREGCAHCGPWGPAGGVSTLAQHLCFLCVPIRSPVPWAPQPPCGVSAASGKAAGPPGMQRLPGDGTRQGREGVGLAAPRDDAVEWGESGQLPEGEQASWALELRAGPRCQLRERKARGNTSIESLLPGAQCLSTWSRL